MGNLPRLSGNKMVAREGDSESIFETLAFWLICIDIYDLFRNKFRQRLTSFVHSLLVTQSS